MRLAAEAAVRLEFFYKKNSIRGKIQLLTPPYVRKPPVRAPRVRSERDPARSPADSEPLPYSRDRMRGLLMKLGPPCLPDEGGPSLYWGHYTRVAHNCATGAAYKRRATSCPLRTSQEGKRHRMKAGRTLRSALGEFPPDPRHWPFSLHPGAAALPVTLFIVQHNIPLQS